MKAIMVNASPKICERVTNGDCTILVKKSMPKIEEPIKCYLYCTKAKTLGDIILCKSEENSKLFGYNTVKGINKGFAEKEDVNLKGKVIGEFICDRLIQYNCDRDFQEYFVAGYLGAYMPLREMYLTQKDLMEYGKGKTLYGWHISNFVIYDTPKSLEMFPTGRIARDCGYGNYMVYDKILTRPPRDWCYVEDKEN